ncbi:hypothetical protein FB446DRAFT_785361 [Lentinula raphanica]|nr:hypothetical protein FB446DRAFT_785361 [Lentinula raphanica]
MKRLHNISTQLHSAAIIESRFLPTTQHHNILPADHLALVAFENLNFLLDCIPSTRTALEIMWWNFLDKDPKRSGKMLTGIINEGRNRPEQYWKKLINISFYDFSSLGVGRWLNDEIINYFVNKWCIQSKKVLGFSTFFASRCLFEENTSCLEAKKWFTEDDEKRVLSWVRARQRFLKLEVWDAVFIPIHENASHWYSAYIDFRLKRIEIYDSLQQTYLDNYTKPAILRKNTRITLVLMWLTEILSQAKGEYLDLKNNQHSGWLFSPHSRGSTTFYIVIDYDAIDYDAIDYDAIDYDAIDYDAIDYDAIDYDTINYVLRSTINYILRSTIVYVLRSTIVYVLRSSTFYDRLRSTFYDQLHSTFQVLRSTFNNRLRSVFCILRSTINYNQVVS